LSILDDQERKFNYKSLKAIRGIMTTIIIIIIIAFLFTVTQTGTVQRVVVKK